MPYSNDVEKIYAQQNINYTNRDFSSLKRALINYTKTYFPQAYKDFNETSPGMMLLELSAYAGDVLNYYVDDSFKEMILPLAEDKSNLLNLAKTTGYKPKPIVPSFTDLEFSLIVDADSSNANNVVPNSSQILTIDKGVKVTSTTNPDVIFETLEPVDFATSSSLEERFIVNEIDVSSGLAKNFISKRIVRGVSGETRTATFNIQSPEKYKKITLPENNVIEILSVIDKNNNKWYEVEFLAQENVPISTYYAFDPERVTAYTNIEDSNLAVPYSLSFVRTTKRFITEMEENGLTSLIFGNGVTKNGQQFETTFLDIEQEGVTLPTTNFSPKPLNPKMAEYYGSLGEAPGNTSLTVTYRVGGGLSANVNSGDLVTYDNVTTIPAGESTANLSVTNPQPALGGKESDTIEEIRQNAIANYSTQLRCVTKEDYEGRIMSLPARYGSIAKVYCTTGGEVTTTDNINLVNNLQVLVDEVMVQILSKGSDPQNTNIADAININLANAVPLIAADGENVTEDDRARVFESFNTLKQFTGNSNNISTVDIYLLSYDYDGNLVHCSDLIKQNIKNYLSQFRVVTDRVRILDGYVVNFGILFDVLAFPNFDKSVIKSNCIEALKEYFHTKNMQFKQVIYSADLLNILSSIEGVKAVNDIILTQDIDYSNVTGEAIFSPPLYSKSINQYGDSIILNEMNYGYYYNFQEFFNLESPEGRGVVLPPVDPTIFELKDPNRNIKGRVR